MPPIDAQTANYFSRLIEDTEAVIAALQSWDQRIQEAYDRRLDLNLPTNEEFAEAGNLDHLTVARLGALLATRNALMTVLQDSGREGWNNLYEVIR